MKDMSALDWTTLTIAIVGAVTGIAALVTQIWGLLLAGPRVKVTVANAFVPGRDGWLLSVDASNVGRLPVTILDVGVSFRVKGEVKRAPATAMPAVPWSNPQCPHRLVDAEAVTWLLEPVPIALTLSELGVTDVCGYVRLATGKYVESRNEIDVVNLASLD